MRRNTKITDVKLLFEFPGRCQKICWHGAARNLPPSVRGMAVECGMFPFTDGVTCTYDFLQTLILIQSVACRYTC